MCTSETVLSTTAAYGTEKTHSDYRVEDPWETTCLNEGKMNIKSRSLHTAESSLTAVKGPDTFTISYKMGDSALFLQGLFI